MTSIVLLLIFFSVVSVGCENPMSQSAIEVEQSGLRQLAIMYGQYVRRNNGNLPKNELQFKQHVAMHGKKSLIALGIEADELFVSPRDGKPYVIFSQENLPPYDTSYAAYEQDGLSGVRLVASSVGDVTEMTDIEFQQLILQE